MNVELGTVGTLDAFGFDPGGEAVLFTGFELDGGMVAGVVADFRSEEEGLFASADMAGFRLDMGFDLVGRARVVSEFPALEAVFKGGVLEEVGALLVADDVVGCGPGGLEGIAEPFVFCIFGTGKEFGRSF